jgi:endoglucanase
MSYNQTFVNAVRSTGGKNSYRNLVIQAYSTNIDAAVNKLVVSTDSIAGRLMVEVHYYDPWDFCGLETDATWATAKFLWGADYAQYGIISSWGQEDYMRSQFQKMKTNFVDKGYPVILGEYGALRRSALTGSTLEHHLASRAYYFQYAAQQAKNNGLVPVIWDNGFTGNFGCGIFNRSDGSVFDRQALNAYIAGASSGTYSF